MPSSDTQFRKGHSGRPKGARNKITKAYLKDVYEIYLDGGKEALKKVMKERPEGFLSLVARLLPKDLDINQSGDVHVTIVKYKDMYEDDKVDKTEDD